MWSSATLSTHCTSVVGDRLKYMEGRREAQEAVANNSRADALGKTDAALQLIVPHAMIFKFSLYPRFASI
jgi:hypothetical protein